MLSTKIKTIEIVAVSLSDAINETRAHLREADIRADAMLYSRTTRCVPFTYTAGIQRRDGPLIETTKYTLEYPAE